MCRDRPRDAAENLHGHVRQEFARCELAFEGEYDGYGRVEMRPGNGSEDGDQHDQYRAGRQVLASKGERGIPG